MNILPLKYQSLKNRIILLTASLLVRISVPLAFWQVMSSSGRLKRSIAVFAFKAISSLAEMLGHLVEATLDAEPEIQRAFGFAVVSEFFAEDGTDLLQSHHSSI